MTDYERRKLKMQNDPAYAKMYRERDAEWQRKRRAKLRKSGIRNNRYIPSLRLGYRVTADVGENAVKQGYMRYLKLIGKIPEGVLHKK